MVQRKWTKKDENFNNLKKANFQWVRRFKNLDLIISTKLVDEYLFSLQRQFRPYNFY